MKNKHWLWLIQISAAVMFLVSLVFLVAVMVLHHEEVAVINIGLLFVGGCLGGLASCVVLAVTITFSRFSDKLDNLDESIERYYEARNIFINKIDSLSDGGSGGL